MRRVLFGLISAAVLAVAIFAAGYFESKSIKIREIDIVSAELPPEFEGIRIAYLSDIYLGGSMSQRRLRATVEQINSLDSDFILFGGNYAVDKEVMIEVCFDELKKLESKIGFAGITGKAENEIFRERVKLRMMKAGIFILDNRVFSKSGETGDIKFAGLKKANPDFDRIKEDVSPGDFCIMSVPTADNIVDLPEELVDLAIAPQVPGAGVSLFGLFEPLADTEAHSHGMKEYGTMRAYVSSGMANRKYPFRLFNRPEIPVFILKTHSGA